ncbi:hypothetical protein GO594_24520 [Pseudomonas otitidis]|uniref:Uncharacterized protein n=1 Tax=Metapseudomonas otitidis TaxID=319939 RepID=A0A7X3KWU3_9GAMM|nr:hypothetical protein [Pseudomonas otitidis]MWK59164.1 hypothetical protein [Pseudomonas otitidis]
MSDSYEIVFQQVAAGDLYELLESIGVDSQIFSELAVSEEVAGGRLAGEARNLIDEIIAYGGDICLTAQLHGFRISEEICLPLVLLRVIKYRGWVDVELSFNDPLSFDIGNIMLAAQRYADFLSNRYHVEEFYGGLEPAADTNTRYFTGNALGPLK